MLARISIGRQKDIEPSGEMAAISRHAEIVLARISIGRQKDIEPSGEMAAIRNSIRRNVYGTNKCK